MTTLIVEDGTGIAGANSYTTAAAAGSYHAARGTINAWGAVIEAGAVTGMLIEASRNIDQSYTFLGSILTPAQGLALPHLPIWRDDDRQVSSLAQVALAADATAHLALRLYQDRLPAGGVLLTSETLPDYSYQADHRWRAKYPEVDAILAPIVDGGGLGGGMRNVKLVRWS